MGASRQAKLDKKAKKAKKSSSETAEAKRQKILTERPKLKKGITLDDIQNCYWKDEIEGALKQNGIPTSGKKAVLNQRLFDFLNHGIKPAPKTPKKKKAAAKKKSKKAAPARAAAAAPATA
eukprot:TRINITY_DN28109_c0_g1_i1.p1 TRINITY_DN28109_c0_g1~~TRINITY_DN28109_c0_g1_i1.p1  ORF type:complete len:121 (-),score=31.10 TRINITY_DN28109_c0_g1_i1:70-432(-)